MSYSVKDYKIYETIMHSKSHGITSNIVISTFPITLLYTSVAFTFFNES